MEESRQQISEPPSYWNSVFLAGAIFGLVSAIGQLLQGYVTINTGEQAGWISFVICLVAAFAGFTALWHYTNLGDFSINLGKGALIGFFAGAIASLLSYAFVEVWKFIDPTYGPALKEASIALIENNPDIPDAWKQQMIDATHDPGMLGYLTTAGGAILTGVLNMLTGMLGVKIFGKQEKEF